MFQKVHLLLWKTFRWKFARALTVGPHLQFNRIEESIAVTYSKLARETVEKSVKYVQS